jgi:hypothetical protein
MSFTPLSDDELLALLLIDTWTLTTGKMLRRDVSPQELTDEELIAFWSDDLDPARHRGRLDASYGRPVEGTGPVSPAR